MVSVYESDPPVDGFFGIYFPVTQSNFCNAPENIQPSQPHLGSAGTRCPHHPCAYSSARSSWYVVRWVSTSCRCHRHQSCACWSPLVKPRHRWWRKLHWSASQISSIPGVLPSSTSTFQTSRRAENWERASVHIKAASVGCKAIRLPATTFGVPQWVQGSCKTDSSTGYSAPCGSWFLASSLPDGHQLHMDDAGLVPHLQEYLWIYR